MIARNFYNGFFTALLYLVTCVTFPLFVILLLPCAFLPESMRYENNYFFFMMRCWASFFVYPAGIRFHIKGQLDNLQHAGVVVANHASHFDAPLVELALAGRPHIWLSKDSFSKIPLLSYMMTRINVSIKRESPIAAVRGLAVAHQRVKDRDCSIVLFPEGTRYHDGQIHHFHLGFTVLARKLRRPVVPILINHTAKILSPGARIVDSYSALVTMIVGPLFQNLEDETDEQFVARVHRWFVENNEA